MNILYVLHKDPDISLGGVERHIHDLVRGLLAKGFKIYLLFPSSSCLVVSTITHKGIEKKKIKGFVSDDLYMQNRPVEERFREILRSLSIDIVHFQHLLGLPLSLVEIAKQYGAKVFITIHDYFFWCPNYKLLSPLNGMDMHFCFFEKDYDRCAQCLELLNKKNLNREMLIRRRQYADDMLRISDGLIIPSNYLRDVFCALFHCPDEKYLVIEHGIEGPEDLSPASGFNDGIRVAYLGAFTYEKGAHIFLELVRAMNGPSLSGEVSFYLIGELGYPLPDDFQKCGNLHIKGAYRPENLNGILKRERIDLILLLSIWPETYSYTLSEAIVNGIPVVASDIGAIRGEDGKTFCRIPCPL